MKRIDPALVVLRQSLAAHILQQKARAGVEIHFDHRLVEIDFEKRVASFERGGNSSSQADTKTSKRHSINKKKQSYDLLIGADGSKSTVRNLLHENDTSASDFSVSRVEEDSMEYQVGILPNTRLNTDTLPEDMVQAWNSQNYNAMCMAFPVIQDRSTLFAAVFPEWNSGKFKTSGYKGPLTSLLPDLTQDRGGSLAQHFQADTSANGGLCVWCSSMGSPQAGVVLVGDAAHGMWPSLGQVANCALETAAVFCETVQDVSRETPELVAAAWSRSVIAEFNQRRHADALAAVDLDLRWHWFS